MSTNVDFCPYLQGFCQFKQISNKVAIINIRDKMQLHSKQSCNLSDDVSGVPHISISYIGTIRRNHGSCGSVISKESRFFKVCPIRDFVLFGTLIT